MFIVVPPLRAERPPEKLTGLKKGPGTVHSEKNPKVSRDVPCSGKATL